MHVKVKSVNKMPCGPSPSLTCADVKLLNGCTACDSVPCCSDVREDLTCLRGIQSSKGGRMIRVVRPQIWTVYCVTAMSLPYETTETTELQVMNCNPFCLCRLWNSVVNYSEFSIVEREKQLFHLYA